MAGQISVTEGQHGPLQCIFSLEGLINGVTSHDDVLGCGRPHPYDLTDFENRVRSELSRHKDLGLAGVVINYGYADEYLQGEDGWQRLITGVRLARELGLRVWIYDEKGYPSGTAGGLVLAGHPELEAVGLKHVRFSGSQIPRDLRLPDSRGMIYLVRAVRGNGTDRLLPVEADGASVKAPMEDVQAIDVYFVAPLYEGTHAALNLAQARRYINVLDRQAVRRFLELTHVRYLERIPADLRGQVDAFFSDEVSLMAHALRADPPVVQQDPVDTALPLYASVPWSRDLEAAFRADHGYGVKEHVPSLFEGQAAGDRRVRRDYWSTVSRRYADSFARQSAEVCRSLGVDFSGHLLAEETLLQQVVMHGSLIQVLKPFHRPGVDLLTCRLDLFDNHILTHKAAQSALFFGDGRSIMSETSDYMECWSGDKKGAPLDEIRCALALQFLMGVRDFCLLFLVDRMTPDDYRSVCRGISRLLELGGESAFMPRFALYYPIEKAWECYVPSCPTDPEICSAGIFGRQVRVGCEEIEDLSAQTTSTVNRLFRENRQFVLCERPDVASLPRKGIATLAYYGPGDPEDDLVRLCRDANVRLVPLAEYERTSQSADGIEAGTGVVLATYRDFVIAVNRARQPVTMRAPGWSKAVFPYQDGEGQIISGSVDLPPLSCVFLIR